MSQLSPNSEYKNWIEDGSEIRPQAEDEFIRESLNLTFQMSKSSLPTIEEIEQNLTDPE
jgi:hypothetical protein